jgi:hypothetical protein
MYRKRRRFRRKVLWGQELRRRILFAEFYCPRVGIGGRQRRKVVRRNELRISRDSARPRREIRASKKIFFSTCKSPLGAILLFCRAAAGSYRICGFDAVQMVVVDVNQFLATLIRPSL